MERKIGNPRGVVLGFVCVYACVCVCVWGGGGLYITPLEQKFLGGVWESNRKNHPWWGEGMDIFWNHTI